MSSERNLSRRDNKQKNAQNEEAFVSSYEEEAATTPGQVLPSAKSVSRSVLQRARSNIRSLSPQDVIQLQRVIGNRAVTGLIQRKKFKDSNNDPGEVLGWVNQILQAVPVARPEDILDLNVENFFGYLTKKLEKDPTYGGDDYASNVSVLYKYQDIINADIEKKIIDVQLNNFRKKRPLTQSQQNHIFLGEAKDNNSKVVGYHWTGDGSAVAEGFGATTPLGGIGCYAQKVRLREHPDTVKDKASTFFPNDWSRKDVTVAIEYANVVAGNIFEVTKPKKGAGLKLFFNGDSYFPYFE